MRGKEIRKTHAAVDREGAVWLFAEFEWRYVVEGMAGACGSALSFDSFAHLPEAYEPYVEVDEHATALLYKAARVNPYRPTKSKEVDGGRR